MRKRVLFVLTSHHETGNPTGYHLAEVAHPYFVLAEADVTTECASVKGSKPPVDSNSHDETDPDNDAV